MESFIKKFIHTAWNSRDENLFPGPHPISIERRHFGILSQQEYVVCEKTDGVRFFIVCVNYNGKRTSVLVNRAFEIQQVSLAIPCNTIIDGELVDRTFYIYDGVIVNNVNIMNMNLRERLAEIAKVIGGPSIGIKLKMKKMWGLSEFSKLIDTTRDSDIDGYIFTPVNEPVKMETHETLFKWKPIDKITVDFLYSNGGLYIWDNKNGLLKVQNFIHDKEEVLECKRFCCSWILVKRRTDKSHPNNRRTYLRTLVNMREAISLEELKNIVCVL